MSLVLSALHLPLGMEAPILIAVATCLLLTLVGMWWARQNSYPFPPGPPGEPILNHLRTIPIYDEARAYEKMGFEYKTDLIGLKIVHQPVVIINSVEAATELLDRRGATNSDRPIFWYGDIMGYIHTLSFMRWGPRMQLHRKVVQRELSKAYIKKYEGLQTFEVRRLIPRIIGNEKALERQVRRAATSVILGIAFGHTIESDDDPYIQIAVDASRGLGAVGGAGTSLLDFFPLARFLPNSLAPAGLIWARDHQEAARRIHQVPCDNLKQQMANGTARSCLLQSLLDEIASKGEKSALKEVDAQGAAVTMYAAGQDTTTSSIMSFLGNMLVEQGVQAKAQAELDAVIGTERLPEYSDRPQLPYIEHLLWEVFRWFPATPIGLSHKSLKDDTYRGYFLPKGTVLIPNAYAMTHDPKIYSNPLKFDPDRYDRGEPAPIGQWGYGRRICPGQHLASSTIWMTIVTVLATVKILPAQDANSKDIPPELKFSDGFGTRVDDFDCRIVYRSEEAKRLLSVALA